MAEDPGVGITRRNRRSELRAANLATWEAGGLDSDDLGSLDASLKRNTAYIKRLRTSLHASDSVAVLTKEVRQLSLDKYISELISAAAEGVTRCKSGTEIAGAVDVLSTLHERFAQLFTAPFVNAVLAQLQPPARAALTTLSSEQREKEETSRVTRQRSALRIYAELELVGLLPPDKKTTPGEATFNVLRDLLTADKDTLVNSIPLAVAFTKHFGQVFLPAVDNRKPGEESLDAEAGLQADEELVPAQQKDKFKKLLVAYYDALSRRAVRDHTHLLETDKRNHEAYIRSGEIFEDRAQSYEKLSRSWEKLWAGVQTLSESLGATLPTLPPLASTSVITGLGSTGGNEGEGYEGGIGSIWADEEEKRFYTDLLDLRGEVPGSLLSTASEQKPETAGTAALAKTTAEPVAPGGEKVASAAGEMAAKDREEQSVIDPEEAMAPAPAAQLSALLAKLPDMNNKQMIDKAAVDFAFLNSKAARRRLVKLLASVPRTRQDLIPYYARLAATLNKYMPDIGPDLVSILEDEFRSLQRRKAQDVARQDLAENRQKNIRFLGELTKFEITPSHSILHVFKVSLDDFSGSSIDNICVLLETCGRYLLRSPATTERMASMLDTLKRKRNVTNLDQRYVTMLDNAYYQCDPPDRPVVVPKERTPMELYIRHLLYNVLAKATLEKVVKLVRKLHWEDPLVARKLYNAFTKVWKVKFSNIFLFAIVLHDLARHRSDFCVKVVDGVLENIIVGMEQNNFKYNQQRVATVKYLGELYTYRMVDSRVVLDTLWLLVTFGHPEGRPTPDTTSAIDTPEDFFRIRLVCTLLDTCGAYFDRGQLRKRMDNFLTFFQMYIRSKRPPPMDIDFMVSDTFETLRPKMPVYRTYEESAAAVDKMYAAMQASSAAGRAGQAPQGHLQIRQAQGDVAEDLSDAEEDDARRPSGLAADEESSSEDDVEPEMARGSADGSSEDESTSSEDEDDEDDDSSSSGQSSEFDEREREQDDEFERELARMMADTSGDVRKVNPTKSALTDVNLLSIKKQEQAQQHQQRAVTSSDEEPEHPESMKFTLLMKKGSKQQTRSMDIPRQSALAMHTLSKQEESRLEQQQLKRLVLNYEQREEEESRKQWVDQAAKRGYRIRFE